MHPISRSTRPLLDTALLALALLLIGAPRPVVADDAISLEELLQEGEPAAEQKAAEETQPAEPAVDAEAAPGGRLSLDEFLAEPELVEEIEEAQPLIPGAPARTPDPRQLEITWRNLQLALAEKRYSQVTAELDNLEKLRVQLRAENLPAVSSALLELARRAHERNDPELAERLLEAAQRFSPDLAAIPLIRGSFSPDTMGVSMNAWTSGVGRMLERLPVRLAAGGYGWLTLGSILIGTAFILALALAFRHLGPFAYDVGQLLQIPKTVVWGKRAAVLLVLLIPLAVGWSVLPLIAMWLAVFFLYTFGSERGLVPVALIFLITAPFALARSEQRLSLSQDPRLLDFLEVRDETWDFDLLTRIEARVAAEPRDWLSRYALGAVLTKANRTEAARAQWEMLSEAASSGEVLTNEAATWIADGDHGRALATLGRAQAASRKTAEILYNRAVALEMAGRRAEAKLALSEARQVAPAKVQDWERWATDLPLAERAVLVLPGDREALDLLARSPGEAPPAGVMAAFGLSSPTAPAAFAGAMLLLTIVLAFAGKKLAVADRCKHCGLDIPGEIAVNQQHDHVCQQCVAAFYRTKGADPGFRTRKVAEVERYQRRQRWLLRFVSLVLPGEAQMARGHPWLGVGLGALALLASVGAYLFADGIPAADPALLAELNPTPILLVSAPLFAIAVLMSVLTNRRAEAESRPRAK